MEIERKYLIKRLPEGLENCRVKKIEQGYLCSHPTFRIRKSDDEYILTIKINKAKDFDTTAICNQEDEYSIPEEAYEHLMEKVDGHVVKKSRYIVPLADGLKAELDVFEGRLSGLRFVEVEFPDAETANSFEKPEWFGEDVSGDKRYRNTYLSKLDSLEDF